MDRDPVGNPYAFATVYLNTLNFSFLIFNSSFIKPAPNAFQENP